MVLLALCAIPGVSDLLALLGLGAELVTSIPDDPEKVAIGCGVFLAIGVVLGSALWLGLFSYKQAGYGDALWWQFALFGDASRFLRASVAVAVIALAAAALHLLASATTPSGIAGQSTLTRAAEIVAQSPEARANLALLGDKRFLFHPAGDSFVMFGIVRRSWVVLGDPIGPFARWRDLFARGTGACEHDISLFRGQHARRAFLWFHPGRAQSECESLPSPVGRTA